MIAYGVKIILPDNAIEYRFGNTLFMQQPAIGDRFTLPSDEREFEVVELSDFNLWCKPVTPGEKDMKVPKPTTVLKCVLVFLTAAAIMATFTLVGVGLLLEMLMGMKH